MSGNDRIWDAVIALLMTLSGGILLWPGLNENITLLDTHIQFRYGILLYLSDPIKKIKYSQISKLSFDKKLNILEISLNSSELFELSWHGLSEQEKAKWFEAFKEKGLEIQIMEDE